MMLKSEGAVTHMQQNSLDNKSISFLMGDWSLLKKCSTIPVKGAFDDDIIEYLDCVSK